MTIYVLRGTALVTKEEADRRVHAPPRSAFPSPSVSRFEAMESPVTGKVISSWRERDRDMAAAGAVDPRDMPPPTRGRKKEEKNVRPKPAASG